MGEAITKADGVIIVTPEYNYSISGGPEERDRLAVASAGAAVRRQARSDPIRLAGRDWRRRGRNITCGKCLIFLDATVLNKPEVMIGQIATKVDAATGELTDEATRAFITTQLQAFATFVRRLG